MNRRTKWDQSVKEHFKSIRAPNEFFGACRNHRKRKQIDAVLGNGYCVKCWDRGMGSEDGDWEWRPKHG